MPIRPNRDSWLLAPAWKFNYVYKDATASLERGYDVMTPGFPEVQSVYPVQPSTKMENFLTTKALDKVLAGGPGTEGSPAMKDAWFEAVQHMVSDKATFMMARVKHMFKERYKDKVMPRRAEGVNFTVRYPFNGATYPALKDWFVVVTIPVKGNHKGSIGVEKEGRVG